MKWGGAGREEIRRTSGAPGGGEEFRRKTGTDGESVIAGTSGIAK